MRIYEYQPSMMHSKTFVVDGVWGSIGSMNFDNRSLAFNNESNLVVLDSVVGAQHGLDLPRRPRATRREIMLAEFSAAGGTSA